LDLVTEFTGMPATFMMGGPEPADKGRLNIIRLAPSYFAHEPPDN